MLSIYTKLIVTLHTRSTSKSLKKNDRLIDRMNDLSRDMTKYDLLQNLVKECQRRIMKQLTKSANDLIFHDPFLESDPIFM